MKKDKTYTVTVGFSVYTRSDLNPIMTVLVEANSQMRARDKAIAKVKKDFANAHIRDGLKAHNFVVFSVEEAK